MANETSTTACVAPNDFAIISGRYKYVYNPGTGKEELYDLWNDVGEKENLVGRVGDEKQQLKNKLITWIAENKVDVERPTEEALESEEELTKRLKALGYIR